MAYDYRAPSGHKSSCDLHQVLHLPTWRQWSAVLESTGWPEAQTSTSRLWSLVAKMKGKEGEKNPNITSFPLRSLRITSSELHNSEYMDQSQTSRDLHQYHGLSVNLILTSRDCKCCPHKMIPCRLSQWENDGCHDRDNDVCMCMMCSWGA